MGYKEDQVKVIGPELANALPDNDLPWYKKPSLRKLNLCLLFLFLFSSADGYDGSMMNGVQALPQWEKFMKSPRGSWLGFINAAQSLGAIVCYPLVAWSNNRFGRRKSIAAGFFWLALGGTLQTAASSPTMFVIGRFFIGGTSAFYSVSSAVLITETAYPTHRGVFTALSNCGWYVGSLVAAWATYGSRNYPNSWAWRIPSLLQVAIPISALPGLFAPESPRYQASKGHVDKARAFLIKYHAAGDEKSELAEVELRNITATLAAEAEYKKNASYFDMFRTKGNRHRVFISITMGIFAQWNGVGIVSYYLAPVLKSVGITSVSNETMISGFLQLWNLIFAVGAAFSVDRVGRRKLFMTSTLGMLACYCAITGLSGAFETTGKKNIGIAVIPFLFFFYAFYDLAFTPLLVSYVCEIWPYNLRARGLSMALMSSQIATFFNIFVNPIALDALKWKYYFFYVGILCFIATTIYFFYPETNGHSLEEMTEIFDGKDAAKANEQEMSKSLTREGV